jgi:hypothetical protein
MFQRIIQRRAAWLFGGVILVLLWFTLGKTDRSVILIEFGKYPQEFEGLEVVIDDEVVGTLQRMGARTQTGFYVEEGDHEVWLKHPELPSAPTQVTSGFGGQRVMLMADFQQRYESGEDQTYVVLGR